MGGRPRREPRGSWQQPYLIPCHATNGEDGMTTTGMALKAFDQGREWGVPA